RSLVPGPTLTRMPRSIEPGQAANRGRCRAPCPKLAQAGRLRRFRQLVAGLIKNQPVMVIPRLGQAKQCLEDPMNGGSMKQVAATHHVGHALRRVVNDDRKMIARRYLLAAENDIAPDRGIDGNRACLTARPCSGFRPGQPAGMRESGPHVETKRVRLTRADPPATLGKPHVLCIAGIERRAVWIARPRSTR